MHIKRFGLAVLKNKGLRGGLIFLVLLGIGCWVLSFDGVREIIARHFTARIAYLCAGMMKLAGMDVYSVGLCIAGHGISIDIMYGCNSVYEIMVFIAAAAAYPLPFKNKIFGIIIGTVAIYVLNLFRVVALFLTGVYFPDFFKLVHMHVAQGVFIIILVFLWLFWAAKSGPKASSQ